MSFWEEQNQRIENGTLEGGEGEQFIMHLDTLLLISGCIDRYVQFPYYPQQAFRGNGYGLETVNETIYNAMVDSVPACLEKIQDCRDAAAISDPENLGIDAGVNKICEEAETFCRANIVTPYTQYSGLDYYDISSPSPPPFPPPFHEGYLNREWVQAELGVPLNWTGSSPQVSAAYRGIGDYPRDDWLEDLGFLLDNGIKVSLVYGDLDFACPVCLSRIYTVRTFSLINLHSGPVAMPLRRQSIGLVLLGMPQHNMPRSRRTTRTLAALCDNMAISAIFAHMEQVMPFPPISLKLRTRFSLAHSSTVTLPQVHSRQLVRRKATHTRVLVEMIQMSSARSPQMKN